MHKFIIDVNLPAGVPPFDTVPCVHVAELDKRMPDNEVWDFAKQYGYTIVTKDSDFSNHNFSYMKRGLYFEQVKRYLDVFPAQNFIFLTFEKDIVKNIESTIKKIQQFLGVDEEKLDCSIISNEAFTPYSIKLNRLMRKNSTFTKKVKSLIPINLKAYVKNLVYKFNKKSNSKPLFALAKEERDKLFFDYFYQDVKLLENLTKVSFNNVWYHDKD